MSGGVDSSDAALLLTQQGYDVTGVYMKNWSQDMPGFACPWQEDYQDAKRVAVQLGIPFKMYDFETAYRQKVVDYMVAEYQAGRTPNPDIMCNQEIKFKLFLSACMADGADMIATGHYSRIIKLNNDAELHSAANADKDQSYFLYRVTAEALAKSLFPLGDITTKAEVRAVAAANDLATAAKKDSQGICFVGKVGIKDFLQAELGTQLPGSIIGPAGQTIGEHDGALFYTIGQRHGLDVGGGLPYYVVAKDMAKNEVYVATDLQDERLWRRTVSLTDLHWINKPPETGQVYHIRTRYRAPLIEGKITLQQEGAILELEDDIRAITVGQSTVLYEGDRIVGGGIVA